MGGYAFGDSAPAARRLALLAELFEPASRAFLGRFAGRELAVDLGCGPGHTTRLLAEVLRPRRTLGLDQSASFVVLAAWATQLAPSGLLLVEEVDMIHTGDPALRGYLEVFAQNLAVWGDQALADGVATGPELTALAADLATVAGGGRAAEITWELRQLAWEADGP